MSAETLFPDAGSYGTARAVWNTSLRKLGEWASDHTYAEDELAVHEGVLYVSLQDANGANNPASEPTWWQRYAPADGLLWVTGAVDPTTGENDAAGYPTPTVWINTTDGKGFIKVDEVATAAKWIEFGGGAAAGVSEMWVDPDSGSGLTGAIGIQSLPQSGINKFDNDLFVVLDVSLGLHVASTRGSFLHDVPRNTRLISTGTGLDGGGSLAADRTLSLDVDGLGAVTPDDADALVIHDDSGGGPAKVLISALASHIEIGMDAGNIPFTPFAAEAIAADTVQDAIEEVATERLRRDFNALPLATPTTADVIAIRSNASGLASRTTIDELATLLGGGGTVESVFGVSESAVEVRDLADLATARDTAELVVYDDQEAAGSRHRRMTRSSLLDGVVRDSREVGTAVASGLAGGGQLDGDLDLELEFDGLAVAPQVQATDAIATYRAGTDTHYVATVTQLAAVLDNLMDPDAIPYDNAGTDLVSTNVGDAIDELDLFKAPADFTGLTTLGSAADADLFAVWDADVGALKAIAKSDLIAGAGGGVVDSVFGISEGEVTVSDLPSETVPAGSDEVVVDQAGVTARMTRANFLTGYVPDTRTISGGNGISGGGNLSGNRTLALDVAGMAQLATEPEGTDELIVSDAGTPKRLAYSLIQAPGVTVSPDESPDVLIHNLSTGYRNGHLWHRSDWGRAWVYGNDGVDEYWRLCSVPRTRIGAGSPPTVDDDFEDRYQFGSLWFTTDGQIFVCQGGDVGAAVWVRVVPLYSADAATAPGPNEDSGDGYSLGSVVTHDVTGSGTQRDLYALLDPTLGSASWAWVGGDRTEVHARRTTNQNVAIASTVTVVFAETIDSNSEFDLAGVFTAKAAGLYSITFSLESAEATVAALVASTWGTLSFVPNTNGGIQGQATMRLAAGETVHVEATFTGEGSIVGDEERTWLQITRIG